MMRKLADFFKNGKNQLITALVLLSAAQAFLLWFRAPSPLPAELMGDQAEAGAKVLEVGLDTAEQRSLLIAFDRPMWKQQPQNTDQAPPAVLKPGIQGEWQWLNPSLLRFQAEKPFAPNSQYIVTMLPENFPAAADVPQKLQYTVKTSRFAVEEISLYTQPAPQGGPLAVVKGHIKFSSDVTPEQFLDNVKLLDPASGKDEPVDIYLETDWWSSYMEFRSAPVEKTLQARNLKLIVGSDLKAGQSEITLGKERTEVVEIVLNPNLLVENWNVTSHESGGAVGISFNSPVVPEDALGNISVSPEVRFTASSQGPELVLSGNFKAGSSYTVTLAKGLRAADGAVLGESIQQQIVIPDLAPTVDFQSTGMFLSKSGLKSLIVRSVNVDGFELTIDRVHENNLFMFLYYYRYEAFRDQYYKGNLNRELGGRIATNTISVRGNRNTYVETQLNLEQYLPKNENGVYRVAVNLPGQYEGKQRWLLLTDLGLAARKGVDDLLVWSVALDDGRPASATDVRLVSVQNQIIARGRTDVNGLWHLKNLPDPKEGEPFMLTARRGDDFTFLFFDEFSTDRTGLDVSGATTGKKGLSAYVYGERDMYRPGETAQGMILLRNENMTPPKPMPLIVEEYDPQGRKLRTMSPTTDKQGTAEFGLSIPEYAVTGQYTLQVKAGEENIGTYRYQVEEFIPDRIAVEVESQTNATESVLSPGDDLAFTARSRYLFGAPAADLRTEAEVFLSPKVFAPKGYEEFIFGDMNADFTTIRLREQEALTSKQGTADFSFTIPEGLRPPSGLEAVIRARTTEQGGRGVTAVHRMDVFPYPTYFGIKPPAKSGYSPGETVEFEFTAVDARGTPVSKIAAEARLYRERWQTVVRKTPEGGYKYESVRDPELLETKPLEVQGSQGSFSFTPQTTGGYRVEVADPQTGAVTALRFYAGGWGYSAWAVENPARLELIPDKDEYKPGETAVIQVRSPFPGRILAAVEGRRIEDAQVLNLTGDTGEIRVKIQEDWSPNVYISALVARKAADVRPGGGSRAVGTAPIFVNRDAKRQKIVINAPETIRPNTTLHIDVQADPGSTVTLAAVDEGILRLINQDTPNPFEFFYAKRGLAVDWFDSLFLLFPEPRLHGKSATGGGMELEQAAQYMSTASIRRVKPVAFWSGPMEIGMQGKRIVDFQIPEFQGALRIMAVAVKDDTFGSVQSVTTVKSPLVVMPTLPRFTAFGETFQAPVTLRNDTGRPGEFTVNMSAKTRFESFTVEPAEVRLSPAPGDDETAYFTVTNGKQEDTAVFTIKAQGNGESVEISQEIPLRPVMPKRSVQAAGSLKSKKTVLEFGGTDPEKSFIPETVTRTLRIGAMPVIRFSGNLENLLGYPYGCAEQIVSKAFPLLYFGDLARELAPGAFQGADYPSIINETIRRLGLHQTRSGGFSLWPGGSEPHPWTSIYATHFLLEARIAGFHVNNYLINSAMDYVYSLTQNTPQQSSEDLQRIAYGLFVAAKGRYSEMRVMQTLKEQKRFEMSPDSLMMLAAAYALTGDMQSFSLLTGQLKESDSEERSTGVNFNSKPRNLALMLLTLMDAAPGDARIPSLVEKLSAAISVEEWGTTQEDGIGLAALGRYFSDKQQTVEYSCTVLQQDDVIAEFDQTHPFVWKDIEGTEPIRIELETDPAPGTVYYSLVTRGAPTFDSFTPVEKGLAVQREWLNRDGEPASLDSVEQGELLAHRMVVTSQQSDVKNAVIQILLPAGLEVENPRVQPGGSYAWMTDVAANVMHEDIRDDRILLFTDIPEKGKIVHYSLMRAVLPGDYKVPPVQAEAMYDPAIIGFVGAGSLQVTPRK